MPFPKVKDYHKAGEPLIPNCYGIFYTLISVCYWLVLSFFGVMEHEAIAIATSVLFGGIMGLLDDLVDLRWRYKAALPIFAALPYMAIGEGRTTINLILIGVVELGRLFLILLVPLIVTITTNVYNQLGGLNGLESISGLVILFGLTFASNNLLLMIVPILCLIVLGYLNYKGKIFMGNVGTYSIGITLAVYSILMNVKTLLLICLAPFILNSLLILYSNYILHNRAETKMDKDGLLYSEKVRSLRTMILVYKRMSERGTVILICSIIASFTVLGLIVQYTLY